jgi:hypothetical protein
MVPTPRMATVGCGMMGVPHWLPKMPGLVIEKVRPLTSSGWSFLVRARSPRSLMALPQAEQALLVRVLDHGHQQAPVERDRDAEVDVAAVGDVLAIVAGC